MQRREEGLCDVESKLLQKPAIVQEIGDLREYLETYIRIHGIEMPCLKLSSVDADDPLPEHYNLYVAEWTLEQDKAVADLESLSQDVDPADEIDESDDLLSSDDAANDLNIAGDNGDP